MLFSTHAFCQVFHSMHAPQLYMQRCGRSSRSIHLQPLANTSYRNGRNRRNGIYKYHDHSEHTCVESSKETTKRRAPYAAQPSQRSMRSKKASSRKADTLSFSTNERCEVCNPWSCELPELSGKSDTNAESYNNYDKAIPAIG